MFLAQHFVVVIFSILLTFFRARRSNPFECTGMCCDELLLGLCILSVFGFVSEKAEYGKKCSSYFVYVCFFFFFEVKTVIMVVIFVVS